MYGNLSDGSVRRRAPKNIGTSPNLFDGPGGLANENASIEAHLAFNVEGPAAQALRKITSNSAPMAAIPPELMRYLAWAASRSLPMQRLDLQWAKRFELLFGNSAMAEPAPTGLIKSAPRIRDIRLTHPMLGVITVGAGEDRSALLDAGWLPDMSEKSNFLEGLHIQSHYFQTRWFPRLRWFTLRPPEGKYFIIGDRPVGWGVPDCLEAPPCCLRDASAFLIAPISHSLILVGRNDSSAWEITPRQVNSILATWSYDWIAGPSADVVADAILDRRNALDIRTKANS